MLYRALALVALLTACGDEDGGLPDTVVVEAQPEVIDIYDDALCGGDTGVVLASMDKPPSGMTMMACWAQDGFAEVCEPVMDWWITIPTDSGAVDVFWSCHDRPSDFVENGGHLLVSYW